MKLAILLSIIFSFNKALECPDLTCAFNFFDGTCFVHSGDHPATKIEFYSCKENQRCNIDDGNYAWYNT